MTFNFQRLNQSHVPNISHAFLLSKLICQFLKDFCVSVHEGCWALIFLFINPSLNFGLIVTLVTWNNLFLFFQQSLYRTAIISYWNIWKSSPMKPSGLRVLFLEWLFISNPISLPDMELSRFPVFFCLSFSSCIFKGSGHIIYTLKSTDLKLLEPPRWLLADTMAVTRGCLFMAPSVTQLTVTFASGQYWPKSYWSCVFKFSPFCVLTG